MAAGRGVEKEADRAANARIAQGLAEWKQVIVVHPDRVIGPQQRHQRFGERRVHRQVCGQFGPAEFGETDAAMQQRPQHAIGEAAVVALVVGLSQADRGKRNAAGLHDVWRERRCTVRDVPGPAEPQAIALVGSVAHRDSQPAGRLAALAWRWHSIGDDHQSGHFQSTPTGVAIASARFVSQPKRLRGWIAALAKPESSATPTRGSVLTRGWDARAPIPGVASSDTQIFSALARIR